MAWLWLASPFVLIAVIARDATMRDLVTVHNRRCVAIGWAGVVAMFLGVALIPSTVGTLLFGIGTPLAGLVVWRRRDDHDDDAGGGEPDDVPPNWDEFERSFWRHVRRGDRPKTPAPR